MIRKSLLVLGIVALLPVFAAAGAFLAVMLSAGLCGSVVFGIVADYFDPL